MVENYRDIISWFCLSAKKTPGNYRYGIQRESTSTTFTMKNIEGGLTEEFTND